MTDENPIQRVGEGQAGPSAAELLSDAHAALEVSENRAAERLRRIGSLEAALRASEAARDNALNEAAECIRTAEQHFQKRKASEAALAEMTKERETAREKGYDDGLRWERVYLVSCPWCGWKTNGEPISAQMTHVIACGDRRIGEERALLSASRAEATKAEGRWFDVADMLLVYLDDSGYSEAQFTQAAKEAIATVRKARDVGHLAAIRAPQPPEPVCNLIGGDRGHEDCDHAPSSPPPPSGEPSPRCGRCELQKIGLPTPGYPHAAGCVNAAPSPEPTREEPRE